MPDDVATLTWLGHSCFHFASAAGVNVLIDPFPTDMGYPSPHLPAIDLMLVSHDHFDHNNVGLAPGRPKVVWGATNAAWHPATVQLRDVSVTVIGGAYHDESQGAQRGRTALLSIASEGMQILHLGDLGHRLDVNLLAQSAGHDVLCIPIGGHFTIDGKTARDIAESVAAAMVVPMHYRTQRMSERDWPIATLESSDFLAGGTPIDRRDSSTISLDPGTLPDRQTIVVPPVP